MNLINHIMPAGLVAISRRGVRRSSKASGTQSLDKNRLQFFSPVRLASLCLCAFVVLLVGCSISAVKHGDTKAFNARVLWWTENFGFDVKATNFNARLNLGKSATDSESVGAVTEGAVKGVVGRP